MLLTCVTFVGVTIGHITCTVDHLDYGAIAAVLNLRGALNLFKGRPYHFPT